MSLPWIRSAAALAALVLLVASPGARAASFDARGSAEQVDVTGVDPGARLALVDAGGRTVATRSANALGGALFRDVAPGSGYRVRRAGDGATSDPLTVLTTQPAPPSTSVYDQTLPT